MLKLTRTYFYSPLSVANKTAKRSISTAVIAAALLLAGLMAQPVAASPDWWDPAWSCRKAITVTELSGSLLKDYQVRIDVAYEPAMRADFGDLRFINAADNLLNYWIEDKTDGASATVWVEVDDIEASTETTIYMYYGNPAASSASDGEDTFIFFDDFSGDLGQWNIHIDADVAINASYGNPAPCLEISGGSTGGYPYGLAVIGSNATYADFQDGIIEADIYPTTNALPEIIFRGNYPANTGYKGRWDTRSGNEPPWMKPPYDNWGEFGTAVPRFGMTNQWQKAKLVINGSTFQIYSNGNLKSTVTNTEYAGPGEIGLANHYGAWARFDNVRVRKYASPEPVCTIGAEECNDAPNQPADLGPAAYTDGGWVGNNSPELTFTQSDPDGTDTVSYTIQIDDDAGFSSPVVDYTSGLLAQGAASFTSPSLPNGDYYWRVMSTDEHDFEGSWTVANGGDVAFRLNTAAETGGTHKDIYHTHEDVHISGSGFPPDSDVDVYVVKDYHWYEGDLIPPDSGTIFTRKTFTTNGEGEIENEVIWEAPLETGEYDVTFDADRNGIYNEIPDLIDDPNHPGFTVVAAAVGGTVHPVDKASILLPWLILSTVLVLAAGGLILVRQADRLREP
jgi:hypothetical protein